ncbi:MAG: hypothetical protein LBI91_05850 [Spirochaetaceae bacterium]|jgi:hypothetical protein|nr:hypothetical protein [Spirochaetaceae bacterium]
MNKFFYKTRFWGFWGIPAAIVLLAVFGALVMLLWNALLPGIAGLPAIDYLQAAGILALARILFGGFGFGRGYPHIRGGNAFREKWMKMTPEEQEEFIRKQGHYHHLFGGPHYGGGGAGRHEGAAKSPDQNQETK